MSRKPSAKSLANLRPFEKNDPRINRNGRPKVLPLQKAAMEILLGHHDADDLEESELFQVLKAVLAEAKNSKSLKQILAAQELLNRVFGKPTERVEVSNPQPIVWNETKTYDGPAKQKTRRTKSKG